ncbi:hypothetical protein E3E14_30505 [Streptomyces sp. ICN441]|uniref:DUF6745 domain-containing protein n=1 Tax=Streptomyces sp. ICN441 TaxID=2558286 RepID=UPI00106A9B76|nr:hypothetical protein [Streptomyces sp. ICN441]TFE36143.1 hypothetical protein E3E14_30505 [Streptomyces sp. ICN441]
MQYIDTWRAVAAATGPADRAAAEEGVGLAYRTAGLTEPERFVWVGSPKAAVTAVRSLRDAGRSVRDEVRTVPWAEERRRVHDALGPTGWAELWGRSGALLWDTTRALAERIRTGVADALAEEAARIGADPDAADAERKSARMVLLDAVLGQHDAAWLAAFDGRSDRLAGLARVARHAGWWWPFEKAVVICERPVELHRDEAGRLDRGDGPALAFPDGFALHAWRGMPVPAEFLSGLASLTPERIRTEENAELRRVMLEFYGYDRYLAESGARPVHRDGTGVLWRIPLADDEDVTMVEVVNSTPEPDGTHKTYWLRVPPETRTAREGVAWTFGLDAEAYAPVRQT